ncbi:serine hydrolase domain-containing protein [Ohtaekwangia koreensis]|uniref:CubicO group peptidase, beta-lactamase class C family n=1 Tax=Ohtaekwangia koreensis TaxID=688867 RepID=A0A1T5MMU3_9BACT|nr:serine hydrolase [Ohtaekwangia koreensis]SKC89238.1 CubicO group peptidase, beta-lactamase class C family [Ohtaekwangia koreensis]
MIRKSIKLILLTAAFAMASVWNTAKAQLTKNISSAEKGIVTGSLKSAGMDSIRLNAMTNTIIDQLYPNIHSVLIVKNGTLVYEQYFTGNDEIWGNSIGVVKHIKDSLHDVRSISKSVVSACIGVAIKQGRIKSEAQKIWDFFPEYKDLNTGEKSNITIKHLLTMSVGLEWNENIPYTDPANSEIQMDASVDPIRFILSRPVVATPGTVWNYNGGCTQVLATIIQKTTGMEVDAFAKEHLFGPLGISDFYWTKFSPLPGRKDILAAASGLRLRSRDMVKFGLLYMNKGIWNGKVILSEKWIADSHNPQIQRDNSGGYGYQFWTWNLSVNNKSIPLAVAVGNGDQRIFFDHQNDLLVVVTAGNYNQWTIKNNSEALLKDYIYPALKK